MLKKILITIIATGIGAFAYWTISPLFIDKELDDALPKAVLPVNPNPVETVTEIELESEADSINQTSTPTELPEVPAERIFPITDTRGHPASGDVRIVVTPDEQIIRYENYDGTNGPDLKIYLASDLEANEFIDLGPSKANKGNINYSVPLDIDIDDYPYVLTWCEAFGVLFDYAEIN
ncbi:MAG: hypothetical protein ACI9VM_000709 [Candidatus Azotimanducaceae bacterium]|jgi:hypothetical protein